MGPERFCCIALDRASTLQVLNRGFSGQSDLDPDVQLPLMTSANNQGRDIALFGSMDQRTTEEGEHSAGRALPSVDPAGR